MIMSFSQVFTTKKIKVFYWLENKIIYCIADKGIILDHIKGGDIMNATYI